MAAVRERQYPVLFSANAFAQAYPKGHEREGEFRKFRLPDPVQFNGLDAALDSAGFVAAVRYGGYRWSVRDYYDLVESYPWAWHASMDYCCEPQIAQDRPLRLLRMAATAYMYGRCSRESARRGLPRPMPVLQGWNPDEYAMCAEWLPVDEWPELVGIGSVCRRHVHGNDGILSILDAVDRCLPAYVKLHLFGVKSSALDLIAHHPRVASVDSMAWDVHARNARRTGRDMDFRIGHMDAWVAKQSAIVHKQRDGSAIQTMLFDPAKFGGFDSNDELVLEALALQYADLIMDGDMTYRMAVRECQIDGAVALAKLRNRGFSDALLDEFDEDLAGFGERVASLMNHTREEPAD